MVIRHEYTLFHCHTQYAIRVTDFLCYIDEQTENFSWLYGYTNLFCSKSNKTFRKPNMLDRS